ncbi:MULTISPECIES: DNA-J related domain-containing protein [Rheinheimera]|uniref:DNA-J related domain-containing protein n=1 Tax=Rheinheimera marina TaxID=1774958 RepID=A0ABV9JLW8_9GAMM
MHASCLPELLNHLEALLLQSDQEISEQWLLSQLDAFFPSNERGELNNLLFQQHFVLYHHLFLLQQQWQQQGIALLWIGYAKVRVFPFSEPSNELPVLWSDQDEKAAYYLDWQNFIAMTDERLTALLDSFWQKLSLYRQNPAFDSVVIKDKWHLVENCSVADIKRRYRQLALLLHPDRGGDKADFQSLQLEYQWLLSRHIQ